MYGKLCDHIFEVGLKISDVKKQCGLGNNNISSRFIYFVGSEPKEFVLHHRMELAKRLLEYEDLAVTQVAFAVGYASPNGFSMTFKRRVGASPTIFREKKREDT